MHLQFLMEKISKRVNEPMTPDRCAQFQETFNQLLKAVYSRIRGQASSSILRGLLDIEVDVGGEDADFNAFSNRQMIALYERGAIVGLIDRLLVDGHGFSTAVNIAVVAQWIDGSQDSGHKQEWDMQTAAFVQAWMQLFALETGVVESLTAPVPSNRETTADGAATDVVKTPQPGEPFVDPTTGISMVYVPGGTFSMGDTFDEGVDDEKPMHAVTLSDFYMAVTPVTQEQWRCLMGENPSQFVADDHPVEQVTLADAMAFIRKLNDACPNGMHFDLPSEAQWEYAARSGGKPQRYSGGEDLEAVGWFAENSSGGTEAVGLKQPNALGLYDMSGNVWEWCRDRYRADAYKRHGALDPVCRDGGPDRVIRGGSWHLDAWSARCARRFRFDPELFGPALGFRVVMVGK